MVKEVINTAKEAQKYCDENITYNNLNYTEIKFVFSEREVPDEEIYDLYVHCWVNCNDTGKPITVQHHKVFKRGLNLREFIEAIHMRINQMEHHENAERFKVKGLDIYSSHLEWNKDRDKIIDEVIYGDPDKARRMAVIMKPIQFNGNNHISGFSVFCPGCNVYHAVYCCEPHFETGEIWEWDKDFINPTFTPEIRAGKNNELNPSTSDCILWVEEGKLVYSSECTHKLAGKTVGMYWTDSWGRTKERT